MTTALPSYTTSRDVTSASSSTDFGSVRARSKQYGVRLAATATLDASSAILRAVAPLTQPPQVKPTVANAIAPAPAP